jgi:hypothetical protein
MTLSPSLDEAEKPMVIPRRATGQLRNVEHILQYGMNLLSIVSLHNDADRAHANNAGTDTLYPQPVRERSILTEVTARISHVMASAAVGQIEIEIEIEIEIVHNMCRQTGPTAVSRASLPSNT